MRDWLRRSAPFVKGVLGGIIGVGVVLLLVHLVTLYLSILRVIAFINQYAEKIIRLP